MIQFRGDEQESGELFFWENKDIFPQGIRRCFWIHKVPNESLRGKHAHRKETQVLIAMAGELEVTILFPDGKSKKFLLQNPSEGLLVPPGHWVETRFSSDAVLLGLSDQDFSEDDYIRDMEEFKSLKGRNA
ncbi:MAG: FdtA/QdtA family cupin domain-containing protein [Algoriphagus sp.]|uniref:sugar 3,4-ketoisomerase n=1 Tax=Algoriphagus sp. TaxID=1872435 RepID=UPI00184DA145|nr:FdtA/QdtA family cupin domain-containing protein [Algoriphagus sp.]NVJ85144.1 FdtA/QdtA family cupin domain-containing protein [Algoriphagus sp.]